MPVLAWVGIAVVGLLSAAGFGWSFGSRRGAALQVRLDERDRELSAVRSTEQQASVDYAQSIEVARTDLEALRAKLESSELERERLAIAFEGERRATEERARAFAETVTTLQDRSVARTNAMAEQRAELEVLRTKISSAESENTRLTTTLEAERKTAEERVAAFAKAEALFRETFTALSAQALQTNSQTFLELAKASMGEFQQAAKSDLDARHLSIDQLVKPMHEGLQRVDEKLQEFDKQRAISAASVQEHLQSMAQAQQQLTGETQLLVRALRAPQVRGQWGELQLKRVVELAGMQEHCDFVEQETVHTDEGRLRPDLIVRLPGSKVVVVDSKAPLSAYLDAIEAPDEDSRGLILDQHAKQVRDHISALADKDYANEFTETPDFVVMFLPGEAFFSAACQRDPNLIEFAIQLGVIPASPTTLVTVLKAVYYGWQQDRIAKNSEEIRDEAMALYDRMRVVGEHLMRIKKGLDGAVGAYNSTVNSLESRVLPTARRLKALGAARGADIEVLEPVDAMPRLPAALELVALEHETSASAEPVAAGAFVSEVG